jgi:hypothetical protein
MTWILPFALVVAFVLASVLGPGSIDAQPRPSSKSPQLTPARPVSRPGQLAAPPATRMPAAPGATAPLEPVEPGG